MVRLKGDGEERPRRPRPDGEKKRRPRPEGENQNAATQKTEKTETVKKENKAQDVTLKVTVNGEQVYKNSVKENNTAVKVDNVSGTGRVQIKVYIDDTLKRTVEMDLSNTTTMTIE